MKLRLSLADRLRCRLSDLDDMPIAEFHLIVAGYTERAKRSEDDLS